MIQTKQTVKLMIYTSLLIFLLSCGDSEDNVQKHFDEAIREAKGLFKELELDQAGDLSIKEMAENEVEKLFTVEYKVVEIDNGDDSLHIEAVLNELGKERWECIAVDHVNNKLRFFCKRKPKSYLRYLGRSF